MSNTWARKPPNRRTNALDAGIRIFTLIWLGHGTEVLTSTIKARVLIMKPTKLNRKVVEQAADDRGNPWAVSDGVLYQLCRDYPGHDDAQGVTAKVLLIGRSYAAALERGRSSAGDAESTNDVFYSRVVPQILRASDLDRRISALRGEQDIQSSLPAILETHSYLCRLFAKLTGKTKRSLASKYLHFHLPELFFIFDNRAVRGLRILGASGRSVNGATVNGAEPEYRRFVMRALTLRDKLQLQFGVILTTRHIDRLLLAAVASRG